MKIIVPVPELILNEKNRSQFVVDPLKYSYFKESVFLKGFESYLKKRKINIENSGMNRFSQVKYLHKHLSKYNRSKATYISYDKKYYIFDILSVDWLAIKLFEFEELEEVEDFILKRSALWLRMRRMFLRFLIK